MNIPLDEGYRRVREQEAETLTEALEKIENVVTALFNALRLQFEIKRADIDPPQS